MKTENEKQLIKFKDEITEYLDGNKYFKISLENDGVKIRVHDNLFFNGESLRYILNTAYDKYGFAARIDFKNKYLRVF